MSDAEIPQADRLEGAVHPREAAQLFGQEHAEQTLLDAIQSGRLHHAWLLTGAKGIGKATLAWRAARFLLARPPTDNVGLLGSEPMAQDLSVSPDHPVARRIAAGSEPGLLSIKRPWDAERKRLKAQITVDEIRRLNGFFGLSAAEGGFRVVIVDSADEMNTAAANALLKVLEEPPKNAILFLVSHQPARLLPTIRSRCRELRLQPLESDDLARAVSQAGGADNSNEGLSELSGGSVGEAMRLAVLNGPELYSEIVELLATAPRMDRQRAAKLVEKAAGRGAEERLDLVVRLMDVALSRLALVGAGHPAGFVAVPNESQVFSRLSPDLRAARRWAELSRDLGQRLAHGRAVNIDPASLLMDAFLKINETAAQS